MAFQVIFMDAGQGDATLIVYPDNTLTLVDCGSKKNKNIVSTEIAVVLNRFLTDTGKRLKALVLTHPDGDHYNLVKPLIIDQGVAVDRVYYGGISSDYSGISSWLDTHSNAVSFSQGHSSVDVVPGLSYDGGRNPSVEVRILAANAGNPKVKADANPNSIVLLVTYFDLNIFLMGDSTTLTEIFLEFRLGAELAKLLKDKRNVLKAGHHGSATSSSESWVKRILPQVVFVSSDTRTFSGVSIPRSTVLDRILALNTLHDFGDKFEHKYVQYNDSTDRHQQVSTTKALYTTLHLLQFAPNNTDFVAYGTSWYYRVDDQGIPAIGPACDWENINKAY
jgi:beta-lactamase superfamily II metal-dependent hydrolase